MLAHTTIRSRVRVAALGVRPSLLGRALNVSWRMANACHQLLGDARAAFRERHARRLALGHVIAEARSDLPLVVLEEGRDF